MSAAERLGEDAGEGWGTPVSSPLVLACAGLIWSLGILIINILPVVFELLHRSQGLNDRQLGTLGAAYVLGSGLATGSGPFWVRRWSPMWASATALAATALGLAVVSLLTADGERTGGWFFIGLASGCAATPAFAVLGDTANPVRIYSLALFGSTLLAAIVSYLLPSALAPHVGTRGALALTAALFALAIPSAMALSRAPLAGCAGFAEHRGAMAGKARLTLAAPILASIAGSVFTGVFMGGVYNFVGPIAAAGGVEAHAAGAFVAMGLIGALLGSVLPSILGERLAPTLMISLAMALVVLTYPTMMGHSATAFGAGFAIHGVFSTMGYAYFLGVVRRLDFTDRIYVAYPALQSLSIAAGTGLTGWLLSRHTPQAFFALAAILNVASWLTLIVAQSLPLRRPSA